MSKKIVVVLGGVYSGIGKGISAASLALLVSMRGYKVNCIKFDPYLNTDASLLRPKEHGESFVTEDGTETDLDLGSYERIVGISVSSRNICTSGKIYKELIEEHERGKFLGQTLQVSPHFTNKVKEHIECASSDCQVCFVELGGTVGDCESYGFCEAIREIKYQLRDDCLIVLVAPIIWAETIKEFKTKPLQQSVKTLQSFGLQPDILLCRTGRVVSGEILDKVSRMTNISRTSIFDACDTETVYQVPIEFYNRHIDDLIIDKFHMNRNGIRIHKYKDLVEKYVNAEGMDMVEIGILGKYENCDEAYLSLKEAIYHAGVYHNVRTIIRWIRAEDLENSKDMRGVWKYFDGLHAVIVPGGFDKRGVEGMIKGIRYVREKKIPFMGICLGLQCAAIEILRNIKNLSKANSVEFDSETPDPVIHYVKGQEGLVKKAGTMRLGSYDCVLKEDSLIYELYGNKNISERHRHRFEVNPDYINLLDSCGFRVVGKNPTTDLVEMMELDTDKHPFFIATQAHPEFKSSLMNPSPMFKGLVKAAVDKKLSVFIDRPSDISCESFH